MPEGHTLHRLARDLAGKQLHISSPQGHSLEAAALDGAPLRGAFAIGNYRWFGLVR